MKDKAVIAFTALSSIALAAVVAVPHLQGKAAPTTAKSIFKSSAIETTVDPLTDTKKHVLVLSAADGPSDYTGKSKIAVRCDAKGLEVIVGTTTYNGIFNNGPQVALRWDDGEVTNQSWNAGTHGVGNGAFFSKDSKTTLSNLANSDKLVFGWTPYNQQQTAATFNLSAHRTDLQKMQQLCA